MFYFSGKNQDVTTIKPQIKLYQKQKHLPLILFFTEVSTDIPTFFFISDPFNSLSQGVESRHAQCCLGAVTTRVEALSWCLLFLINMQIKKAIISSFPSHTFSLFYCSYLFLSINVNDMRVLKLHMNHLPLCMHQCHIYMKTYGGCSGGLVL